MKYHKKYIINQIQINMLTQNSQLRAQALQSLRHKWMKAALAVLVYGLLSGATNMLPYLKYLLVILVGFPLSWGLSVLFLDSYRGSEIRVEGILDGFKDYGRILGTTFLVYVYTILWSLLLIIPGIIKGYSYAMTNYILKDEPTLKYNEAIEKSMAMMDGNKMKLFLLHLSFIGWIILSCITLGIGFLFLAPYMSSAQAAFYEDLKKEEMSLKESV